MAEPRDQLKTSRNKLENQFSTPFFLMPLSAEVTQHSQTDISYRAVPATLCAQQSFQFKNIFLLEIVEIIQGYMKTKAVRSHTI